MPRQQVQLNHNLIFRPQEISAHVDKKGLQSLNTDLFDTMQLTKGSQFFRQSDAQRDKFVFNDRKKSYQFVKDQLERNRFRHNG